MYSSKLNQIHSSEAQEIKSSATKLDAAMSRNISSESLFAGARELVISHAGGEYRLRLTNQGKLILTK